MPLLNAGNTKTRKGEKKGFITFGLHLAPASLSGFNVCSSASCGCIQACLNTAGRGIMSNVQTARIEKTKFFFKNRPEFMAQLEKEIGAAIRKAKRKGMTPCFRLNLTSDLPWEKIKCEDGQSIIEKFPDVQFYDYTKHADRMSAFLNGEFPDNYHLTFSRSEEKKNQSLASAFLASAGNVAAVFRDFLPDTWQGKPVVDGDDTDLRFLDPQGCVVGLIEKGKAKADQTGFVIEASAAK